MRLLPLADPAFPELENGRADWLAFLVDLAAGIGPAEDLVELNFLDDAGIRALNAAWRGLDAATDVLSFHYGRQAPDGAEDPVGEIFVSVERAREQAARWGHGAEEELSLLVIHGLFHIMGMDHEDEEQAALMAEAEQPYRDRLAAYFAESSGRS